MSQAQGRRSLAGMNEEQLLDELMAAVRAIALEDGVPARLGRRGYGHFSVEVTVRNYKIVGVDVASRGGMRDPP